MAIAMVSASILGDGGVIMFDDFEIVRMLAHPASRRDDYNEENDMLAFTLLYR